MIISGKFYTSKYGIVEGYLITKGGVIANIKKSIPKYTKIHYNFNRKGYLILPGMIDLHVHMRDFDYSYKEDFKSGSMAAAAGGVTVICDMPNTRPRVNKYNILERRDALASANSIVDYGLYYGLPQVWSELRDYEEYAVGMKIYPNDFYNREMLKMALKYNRDNNILTVFHPEDPSYIERGDRGLDCELSSLDIIVEYHREIGFRCHITHVTSSETVGRAREYGFTTDTCPHYLLLSKDKHNDKYFNVYPPLRSEDTRIQLLDIFSSGLIDAYSTDHAPHTLKEKLEEDIWGGFPGLETALPILLTLVDRGYITIDDVVRLYSRRPAEILGISNYYGDIHIGKFASFTVVDIYDSFRVIPYRFYSKAKHSPFEDWILKSTVVATFVRGQPVFMDREFRYNKGAVNVARYIRRSKGS